jgi:hypothetical protein
MSGTRIPSRPPVGPLPIFLPLLQRFTVKSPGDCQLHNVRRPSPTTAKEEWLSDAPGSESTRDSALTNTFMIRLFSEKVNIFATD